MTPRIAVVGGGISGLAAALRLRDRLGPDARITVWEQGDLLGGKLRTRTLAGVTTELGADAFLVREPGGSGDSAAVTLARRVGLELVHPRPVPPELLVDGALHPIPGGTLLGVPGDLPRVAAIASPAPERDRDRGRPLLGEGADVAVGELVRRRLGDEVVDRLVDPMLGGVYAGRADDLSLAATMPALAVACTTATTLTGAVRAALAVAPRPAGGPVFASVRGGLSRLVDAVVAASGARVHLGATVRELARTAAGWRLMVGSTRDAVASGRSGGASDATRRAAVEADAVEADAVEVDAVEADALEVDAVVLALPSRPAARLLRDVDETAAALVGALDYASVGLVTLALPGQVELPDRSGFLVPAVEGTTIKAATFMTRKWAQLRADRPPEAGAVLVRMSVGRYREEQVLRLADDTLARRAHEELSTILGRSLPAPLEARVHRWGGALPQYTPGHLDRVAGARSALPATLRLAGAGYDGVGIPACIRSGQTAADGLAAMLEQSRV